MIRIVLTVAFLFLFVSNSEARDSKIHVSKLKVSKKILASKKKKITDMSCLAKNVYFESRGESVWGQMAVALVTLERAQITGNTVCEEVNRPNAFSWTSNKKLIKDPKAFELSYKIAQISTFLKYMGLDTLRADHYHSKKLVRYPRWAYHFDHVASVGNHIFYRSGDI